MHHHLVKAKEKKTPLNHPIRPLTNFSFNPFSPLSTRKRKERKEKIKLTKRHHQKLKRTNPPSFKAAAPVATPAS